MKTTFWNVGTLGNVGNMMETKNVRNVGNVGKTNIDVTLCMRSLQLHKR